MRHDPKAYKIKEAQDFCEEGAVPALNIMRVADLFWYADICNR